MADDPWAEFRTGGVVPKEGADDPWAAFRVPVAPIDRAIDVAKSGGVGLGEGAIGLAGMAGDVQKLGADYLGVTPPKAGDIPGAEAAPARFTGMMPGSGAIKGAIEQWTGPFYEPKTPEGNVARTMGQYAPGMAMSPGGMGARFLTGVALPALGSELGGIATEGSPMGRVVGGFAGAAAPSAAGKIVSPMQLDAGRRAAVDTLKAEGVNVSAGQQSGNQALRYGESVLGDAPGAGGKGTAATTKTAEQFTSAALKRVGESATRATPEVIDRGFTRIGNNIETIATKHKVNLDQKVADDLVLVEGQYNDLVNATQRSPVIAKFIKDIGDEAAKNYGYMPGEVYQAWRSRLAALERKTNDPHLSEALSGVRNALDDAFERSLMRTRNVDDFMAMKEARSQYRNMLVIERAATAPGSDAASGLLSPQQMRTALVNQGRRDYSRGRGDFSDLVHAGNEVMAPLPNSGTAQRAMVSGIPAAAAGGLAAMFGGGAPGMGGAVMAGAAAPGLMGRALMNPLMQGYLKNQVATPWAQNLDLAKALHAQLMLQGPRPFLEGD